MDLLFPLLIVFMIGMIFFSNRQRKKQAQQQESLQSSITVGDVVVMTCGVSGTVVDTDDEKTIDLEIAPDVITTWLRAAVREKLAGDADVLVGDVEHLEPAHSLGDDHTVVDAPRPTTTDATTGHAASTTTPATHTTAAPAAGSDGAAAEPGLSDPTAAPNANGVSAGTSNPGDHRSSS